MRIKERWQICKCHRGEEVYRTGLGVWTCLYEALHKHTSCFSVSPSSSSSACWLKDRSVPRRTALRSSLTEAPPHCVQPSQRRSFRPLLQLIITQAEVLQKVTANHLCRSQGSAVNRDTWTSLRAATSSSSSEACPCPGSALPVQHPTHLRTKPPGGFLVK